jgi:hypothetical protein
MIKMKSTKQGWMDRGILKILSFLYLSMARVLSVLETYSTKTTFKHQRERERRDNICRFHQLFLSTSNKPNQASKAESRGRRARKERERES